MSALCIYFYFLRGVVITHILFGKCRMAIFYSFIHLYLDFSNMLVLCSCISVSIGFHIGGL